MVAPIAAQTVAPPASKPDYTTKVDALLAHVEDFTAHDFIDLALAAADQAGASAKVQTKIAGLLETIGPRVTDEQIEALAKRAASNEDFELFEACETALRMIVRPEMRRAALACCASAIAEGK